MIKLSPSKQRKNAQLGMHYSTARNRLQKDIFFELVQMTKRDVCFRCGNRIETVEELSTDHKVDWMYSENPARLYFDKSNIAFSHLECNVNASRQSDCKVENGRFKPLM